jgi:basic membrane protein A
MIVGVDTDWTVSAPEYTDVILTSVKKNIDIAVLAAIGSAQDGKFKGGVYLSTLQNGGVGLAGVTGASDALKAELDQVKADIISGKITMPK